MIFAPFIFKAVPKLLPLLYILQRKFTRLQNTYLRHTIKIHLYHV